MQLTFFKDCKNNREIKAFVAIMSGKNDIQLDPDEVAKVNYAWASGAIVRVRQGFINPSYLQNILFDHERVKVERARWNEIQECNKHLLPKERPNKYLGMAALLDIFDGIPLELPNPGKPTGYSRRINTTAQ